MEHRWGMRQPVRLEAVIDCAHHKRTPGCIRDISSSGAFVTASAQGLPLNALVMLIFALQDRGVIRFHRMRAMVTRIAADGVGLMFDEPHRRQISVLLASLDEHRIGPPMGKMRWLRPPLETDFTNAAQRTNDRNSAR